MCIWLSGGLVSCEGEELRVLIWQKAEVQIARTSEEILHEDLNPIPEGRVFLNQSLRKAPTSYYIFFPLGVST